jgi:tetratricopeptide (TPR) repeat protein
MENYRKYIYLMFIFFLIAGCKENYKSEKLLWKADQYFKKVLQQNRGKMDLKTSNEIISQYRKITNEYPTTLSAARSHMIIGNIYLKTKQFDKAIKEYKDVKNNFSKNSNFFTEASFILANIYELKGEWDKGERELYSLSELYPFSLRGLQAPLYISNHYLRDGNIEKAKKSYQEAEIHYKKLAEDGNTELRSTAYIYLVYTELQQNKYQDAISILDKIIKINKEKKSAFYPQAIYMKAEIFLNAFKNSEKAKKLYQEVRKDFPETKWAIASSRKLILINSKLLNEKKD